MTQIHTLFFKPVVSHRQSTWTCYQARALLDHKKLRTIYNKKRAPREDRLRQQENLCGSRNVKKDEKLIDFLVRREKTWQFNFSQAPSWERQFERPISLVNHSLYKSNSDGNLRWQETEQVI